MAAAGRLEQRPAERVHDAVTIVRLLVKAGEFEAARRAGDSLLRTIRAPTSGVAGVGGSLLPPAGAAPAGAGARTPAGPPQIPPPPQGGAPTSRPAPPAPPAPTLISPPPPHDP